MVREKNFETKQETVDMSPSREAHSIVQEHFSPSPDKGGDHAVALRTEESVVIPKKKKSKLFDMSEFEDDDFDVPHPENHSRFPLEKKMYFYVGIAILIIPALVVIPTPIPSWLVLPLVAPIAVFFMAKGVGKEHANWHAEAVPRKIRIWIKNFIRGIFG